MKFSLLTSVPTLSEEGPPHAHSEQLCPKARVGVDRVEHQSGSWLLPRWILKKVKKSDLDTALMMLLSTGTVIGITNLMPWSDHTLLFPCFFFLLESPPALAKEGRGWFAAF